MNILWDGVLERVISEVYEYGNRGIRIVDMEDKQVQSVLIVLHETVQGKHSLEELTQMNVNFARGIRMIPLIERPTSKLWTPREL